MKKKVLTISRRTDIRKAFVSAEDVVLRMNLTDAVITNQKLILTTLLDIRDLLIHKRSRIIYKNKIKT